MNTWVRLSPLGILAAVSACSARTIVYDILSPSGGIVVGGPFAVDVHLASVPGPLVEATVDLLHNGGQPPSGTLTIRVFSGQHGFGQGPEQLLGAGSATIPEFGGNDLIFNVPLPDIMPLSQDIWVEFVGVDHVALALASTRTAFIGSTANLRACQRDNGTWFNCSVPDFNPVALRLTAVPAPTSVLVFALITPPLCRRRRVRCS